MKNERPVLVMVDWEDAHAGSKWLSPMNMAELHSPMKVTWIGFLVHNDEKGVTLSFGLDENGNWSGNMFIPKSCITKIRKVKY